MHPFKRSAALLLTAALLCCCAFGCRHLAEPAAAPHAEEGTTGISVVDMMGRTVTLAAPASRIVVLTAAECEILYTIGAGDALVARGAYCDYPPEALALPAVQSGKDTNVEQIMALSPQLVLTSDMEQSHAQIEQLEAAGIPVAICDAHDFAGVYTALTLTGTLTGRQAEAAAVSDNMRAIFADLAAREEKLAGKSVYFEVSPLEYGLWTAGSGTFMNETAALLGLTNIFADVEGWVEVSEEQVLSRAPDYIVTVVMYTGEGPGPKEEILARPGWESVPAVKNGAVLEMQNSELTRPGPRLADGAQLLYDFVCGAAQPDA